MIPLRIPILVDPTPIVWVMPAEPPPQPPPPTPEQDPMSLTLEQARDEILARVKAVVDAMSADIRPILVYDDAATSVPRDRLSKWARVKIQHFDGEQATLANQNGRVRWRSRGILVVQVFSPSGKGLRLADKIAATIRSGFRNYATPGGVWFRNPRVEEIGNDGNWHQMNFLVDFEYDEAQ